MKMDMPKNIPKDFKVSEELMKATREAAEATYKETPEVYCPYFKDKVKMNAKGLEHISFKDWNKNRLPQDQYKRFKLLKFVPEILRNSGTAQGVFEANAWERIKSHGKWISVLRKVMYWEFVSVIGRARIKIVVKQIEGGERFFWSIIPFWKMNFDTNSRVLHEGNPEND